MVISIIILEQEIKSSNRKIYEHTEELTLLSADYTPKDKNIMTNGNIDFRQISNIQKESRILLVVGKHRNHQDQMML